MAKRFTVTLFLLLVATVVAVFWAWAPASIEPDLRARYLKAGDFQLEHEGKPFSLSQLQGSPVVLYFGYTFCPDVCPVGLSRIREALLSSDDFNEVPVLFITLDPDRDTTERLRDYVSFFHSNIRPLRGSIEQTSLVTGAYGAFFRSNRDESQNKEAYTVDHSAYVYLLDREGGLIRVLDHDVTASEIAELLHKLL